MENRCPTTSRRVRCLPCRCLLVGYGRFSPKTRNLSNAPEAHGGYLASSCFRSLNHYILWSPTLVPEGPFSESSQPVARVILYFFIKSWRVGRLTSSSAAALVMFQSCFRRTFVMWSRSVWLR